MTLLKKSLVAVAVALVGSQARSLISKIEIDDILQPMGLARRGVNWGPTFAVLGAGIVVGGSAILLLAPSAAGTLRERIVKNLEAAGVPEGTFAPESDRQVRMSAMDDNHRSEGIHAGP